MSKHTDGPAPAYPPHDFSAAAILSRARAYAAERAAELAARPAKPGQLAPVSSAEILAALAAGLDALDAQAEPQVCPAPVAVAIGQQDVQVEQPSAEPHSPGRRLALFGGAAALLAPPLAHPAAARVPEADAELARLADEIDRTLDGAAYAMEPADDEEEQDRRIGLAVDLMDRMAALPAAGLAGVKAKAKAYLDLWSYDVDTADLSRSLAEDAERVCAEVLA